MNPRPRVRKGPRGSFAERLRSARAALGYTQEATARLLGVRQETVARWESGARKPSPLTERGVDAWIAAEKAKKGGARGS